MCALIAIYGTHRDGVDQENDGRIQTHVPDAPDVSTLRQQDIEAHDANQHDTKPGGKNMAGAGAVVHRFTAVQKIQDHNNHQIKNTTPQHIAHCNLRGIRERHRADAGDKFRQRGHRGEQDQPDPGAAHAGFFRDHIAIARQLEAGDADQQHAQRELRPDPKQICHRVEAVA